MPKPQGTYLKIKANERIAAAPKPALKAVNQAELKKKERFYKALNKHSEQWYTGWRTRLTKIEREMKADGLKKYLARNEKESKELQEMIENVADVFDAMREHVAKLESSVQHNGKVVVSASRGPHAGGFELALVLALLQILVKLALIKRHITKE
ncbi:MAG: hypothetical protein JWP52_3324 [Rhizobacter sp.]|nr:hypothetical protein [Rhizobacter sp.]